MRSGPYNDHRSRLDFASLESSRCTDRAWRTCYSGWRDGRGIAGVGKTFDPANTLDFSLSRNMAFAMRGRFCLLIFRFSKTMTKGEALSANLIHKACSGSEKVFY